MYLSETLISLEREDKKYMRKNKQWINDTDQDITDTVERMDIREVNIDVIRELRLRGLYQEANDLVRSFHKQTKLEGKRAFLDCKKQQKQKYLFLAQKNNWCIHFNCKLDRYNSSNYCEKHFHQFKNSQKKYLAKRKKQRKEENL